MLDRYFHQNLASQNTSTLFYVNISIYIYMAYKYRINLILLEMDTIKIKSYSTESIYRHVLG